MPNTVTASGLPFVVVPSLTRIAMAVTNEEYIADAVIPRVPVAGELFEYTKVALKDGFQTPDDLIGRTGKLNELEFSSSDETDRTIDRGLAAPVPQKDVIAASQANMADPRGHAAESLTHAMLLNREVRAAALLFDANNYAAGLKLTLDGTSGKYRWDDATNGDPIAQIENALGAMLVRPNTLTVGYLVWLAIRKHPKVISRLYGAASTRGTALLADVMSELELDSIRVGRAWKDTAAKGQTMVQARVWGNFAALTRVQTGLTSARTVQPTFAMTAQFQQRQAGTYFDPSRGRDGVEMIKVTEAVKELVAWQSAGYLFTTPVTP